MNTNPILAFIIIIILTAFSCSIPKRPLAIQGTLNATDWDFTKNGVIPLDGMWEFYWKQLICSKNIIETGKQKLTGYCKMPKSWNGHKTNNQNHIQGDGFASYRLCVIFNKEHQCDSLFIKYMNTAYQLFINRQKITGNGTVGQSRETTVAEYKPIECRMHFESNIIEIILEISNYEHKNGGPVNSIIIGSQNRLQREQFLRQFLYTGFFGFFIIISFYYLIIFIINFINKKRDFSLALFSLFCLINALKIIATEKYLIQLIPEIYTFPLDMKIGYFSYYFSLPVYFLFLYVTFYSEIKYNLQRKIFFSTTIAIGIFCNLIVIAAPIKTFQNTFIFYNLFALLSAGICLYILGTILFREKKRTNELIFWGTLVLFISGLNDIIYDTFSSYGVKWINYLLPGGSVVIILMHYILKKDKKILLLNKEIERKEKKNNILEKEIIDKETDISTLTAAIISKETTIKELNEKMNFYKNIYSLNVKDKNQVITIFNLIGKRCKEIGIELTNREKEIFFQKLLVGGTNKEIAARLFISEGTVKLHWNKVKKKIGLKGNIEFLRFLFDSNYQSG